jgi:hypothetical protein
MSKCKACRRPVTANHTPRECVSNLLEDRKHMLEFVTECLVRAKLYIERGYYDMGNAELIKQYQEATRLLTREGREVP